MKKAQEAAMIMAKECLGVRMRIAGRTLTAKYDHALRPFGLRIGQATILAVLALAGKTSPKTMAQLLHMDKSTLSRNLSRMTEAGWIESEESGGGMTVFLTEKGASLLVRAFPAWNQAQEEVMDLLEPSGVEALRLLADRVWPEGP